MAKPLMCQFYGNHAEATIGQSVKRTRPCGHSKVTIRLFWGCGGILDNGIREAVGRCCTR